MTTVVAIFVDDFLQQGLRHLCRCSMLHQWIRAGLVFQYEPPPDQRAEILKNATTEFVRQVALRSFICERSSVGIVGRAKARGEQFDNPPEGFELSQQTEPAFAWLFSKTDAAVQAMRVLRYLIAKNNIGELTSTKREYRYENSHQGRNTEKRFHKEVVCRFLMS